MDVEEGRSGHEVGMKREGVPAGSEPAVQVAAHQCSQQCMIAVSDAGNSTVPYSPTQLNQLVQFWYNESTMC